MTRKKKAEEDRMEWGNGGKAKKNRAACCILVTHQGLETKASPSVPSSAPPQPPKLSLLTGREGDRVVQLPDRQFTAKPHICSYLFIFSLLPGSSVTTPVITLLLVTSALLTVITVYFSAKFLLVTDGHSQEASAAFQHFSEFSVSF